MNNSKIYCKRGLISGADPDNNRSWIFDRRGLLRTALKGKIKYKRGWNGQLQEINLSNPANKTKTLTPPVKTLNEPQKWNRLESLHQEAWQFFRHRFKIDDFPGPWSKEKYRTNQEKFSRIYRKVPILPPDCYRSLVLQLTTGCSYNQCRFCDFYENTSYTVKNQADFSTHLENVLEFFRPTLPYFNSIFLGAGDGLAAPAEKITGALKAVRESPATSSKPVACFGSGFLAQEKKLQELKEFKKLGLERVYLGLETGSSQLLEKLNKPFDIPLFKKSVEIIKEAKIKLGIIVLLGAGGEKYAEIHPRETAKLLADLPLKQEDLIFLSPLSEGKIGWTKKTDQENLCPLNYKKKWKQKNIIEKSLKKNLSFCYYPVDKFIY